ncbi:hypothetical protein JTB14_007577 [Gonioctena quinquepunctata]|nr:hypothetical protein JTB14_007577 [Gonioctena quinquepunctata]
MSCQLTLLKLSKGCPCYKSEFLKRIYSRIIKNEIACEYNWHGLKGKKALRESLLAKGTVERTFFIITEYLISEAIMKNKLFGTSEKSIKSAIKSWLRHARERMAKKGATQGGDHS